jgi:hypothetical protein
MASVLRNLLLVALGMLALQPACGASHGGFTPSGDGGDGHDDGGGVDGASCGMGQASCAGACTSLGSDPMNCGACGKACGTGDSCCSGTCMPTESDPANCGGCGVTCSSAEQCCSAACVTAASCAFAVTSLNPAVGWQNGGGYVTLTGAGFAQGTTVTIAGAETPALYVNPTTLFVQTPPGPLGPQNVTVSLGGSTATLPGGFTYQQAGLESMWQQKNLTVGRANGPALAVLQDGRVLIAGGTGGLTWDTALPSADLYTEPAPSAVAAAGMMNTPRFVASAVPLLTGKVLVAGGACEYSAGWPAGNCLGDPTEIDLFDPTTNTFTASKAHFPPPPAAAMESPAGAVAVSGVLLADGRVFLNTNTLPTAFVYDPVADSLTPVAFPAPFPSGFLFGLDYAFVVRLLDGRVLVAAGDLSSQGVPGSYTFLFDPTTNTMSSTGAFAHLRSGATANTLPDGRVMVLGGADPNNSYLALASIELYDPTAGTFSLAPYTLSQTRSGHASVLVRDGTVLALGGSDGGIKDCTTPSEGLTATVDQIDPIKGTVVAFPPLPRPAEGIGGVVTLDGSVFVGGGAICGNPTVMPYVDFLQGQMAQ